MPLTGKYNTSGKYSYSISSAYNTTAHRFDITSSNSDTVKQPILADIAIMTYYSAIQIYALNNYQNETYCQCNYYEDGVFGKDVVKDKSRSAKLETAMKHFLDYMTTSSQNVAPFSLTTAGSVWLD